MNTLFLSLQLKITMINKSARLLLIFVLTVNCVFAQSNFKITGDLPSEVQGNIQLRIDKKYLNRAYDINGSSIINGHFELKSTLERNYIVELTSSFFKTVLYAEAGEELNIKLSGDNKDVYNSLKGKGAEQNQFMNEFLNHFKDDFNDSLNEGLMKISTIDKYESTLFSKRKAQLEYSRSNARRNTFSADFVLFIENEISYNYWKGLFAYPIVNANTDQKIMTVNELPAIMLTDFSQVKVNNEPAMISKSYRDFIKYFIIYSTSKSNGFKKFT